jgi:glycosyltransferase involved in cell wall biosynthesis/GT2 family glycosyltransferase
MRDTSAVGRICIVANELPHLFRNGGIGTHNWLLAEALADAGWSVHVLYCAEIDDHAQLTHCRRLWNAKGITLWHLPEFGSPAEDSPACGLIGWLDRHSLHVRRALEQLEALHHFDLIEFAEWSGYAFRTVQARVMGTTLTGPRIIVKLHSSSQWCRDGNRAWLAGSDDLIRDYFERYSFEQADFQFSPSRYMFDYATGIGWNVRSDARVVPNCYPPECVTASKPETGTLELVFFGRLESRKGLKLFLDVVQGLPEHVPVSFLGRELSVDGIPAGELIARTLVGRPYTVHTQFDRQQALAYLGTGNRVAIIPSLIENYPFTVLECAANGIPFLASSVGGIPEIVAERDMQEALLFEPTPAALRQQLENYFDTGRAARCHYVGRMREICNSKKNHAVVCQQYAELLSQSRSAKPKLVSRVNAVPQIDGMPPAVSAEQPLVSLAVPYYNLGKYLPETLASLAAQDYARTEVIVVNDGSTDAAALEVWERMQAEFPQFHYVEQVNKGLGAARNAGLAVANGEFFLPVDADNIARPDMVTQFLRAMQRNPELSVATCYFLAFEHSSDIAAGKFSYAYRPCGGPFVAAALRNVYGDANAMFRTVALRSVGGFETEKETTCEDWEVYVKLVRQGGRIDVVPEYLFYYRHRPASLLRTTDSMLNRRRVLRQFFSAGDLPQAEQIGLWTALASFDEGQRMPQTQATVVTKQKSVPRKVVREVKRVLRKAPYYSVVSGRLKQWKRRAA